MIFLYHVYIFLITKLSIVVDVKQNNYDRYVNPRSIITYNQIARQICKASERRNFKIDIWLNSKNIRVVLALATPFGMGISQWKRNDHR